MNEDEPRNNAPIGRINLLSGQITEEDLYKTLAEQFSLPFMKIDASAIDATVISAIPRTFAEKYLCIPVGKEDDLLTLAVADPRNIDWSPNLNSPHAAASRASSPQRRTFAARSNRFTAARAAFAKTRNKSPATSKRAISDLPRKAAGPSTPCAERPKPSPWCAW